MVIWVGTLLILQDSLAPKNSQVGCSSRSEQCPTVGSRGWLVLIGRGEANRAALVGSASPPAGKNTGLSHHTGRQCSCHLQMVGEGEAGPEDP